MTSILIATSLGELTIELDEAAAPGTAKNFKNYVEKKFYDGTIFHRVIDGFMIQGGGMDATMKEKQTDSPIKNEANNGLHNDLGTVAMARTSDPHSASSQFFINIKNNDFLNHTSETPNGWGYCVFGKVTDGMETIIAIKSVATGSSGGHQDVPSEAVEIIKATILS
jgi:peptidyl-prolyl cis-trans isomerase B (cyclophilin B)